MEDVLNIPSVGDASDNDDVTVTNAAGGVVVLPANQSRKSALIINTGGTAVRVTTDGSNPTATRGKVIQPGGSLNLSSPFCPIAAVKAFCVSGSTTVNASEVS